MISYDAGATSYDLLTGRWSRLYIPTLLAEAGVGVGHRIPDVATGTGEAAVFAASLVGTSGRVVGIDVSGPMLAVAAAKIAKLPIVLLEMDAQRSQRMSSSVSASDSGEVCRRRGAELHVRAARWLASARRGRSTWRYTKNQIEPGEG